MEEEQKHLVKKHKFRAVKNHVPRSFDIPSMSKDINNIARTRIWKWSRNMKIVSYVSSNEIIVNWPKSIYNLLKIWTLFEKPA